MEQQRLTTDINSPPPPPPHFPNNHRKKKKFIITTTMAGLLSLTLFSFLLFFFISAATRHHSNLLKKQDGAATAIIGQACRASRDPATCQSYLTQRVPPNPTTVLQTIQTALNASSQNLRAGQGMVRSILGSAAGNQNLTNTARICIEVLNYSEYRTNATVAALTSRAGGSVKDARAWASAALAYQYDCWGGLKYVNATSPVASEAMSFFNDTLIVSTSNALAMLVNYDIYGDKTGSWGPVRTERDGFWEPGSGSGPSSVFPGGVPKDLKVDVTVCKNGTGCGYRTVQEAVDAAPANSDARFVIRIREGVYEETVRVPFEKRNLVFLGDGKGKTVITGSLNVGMPGVNTYSSATVGVLGDGFMASNLTIQNTAGADAHQAVAFRSDSDLSVIEDCEFIGNQDTLYVHSLRQYYKSCLVQGNIDFIFGNSAAFFQDCLILVGPRQTQPEKGENNAVTAHGRTDPGQSTGFVFQNCVINGTDAYMSLYYKNPSVHKNYLGRPWKEYSRMVFVGCTIEALIAPEGWMIWSGDFALRTLYYGEFANKGPGADTSGRVSWSSKIPADRAYSYSLRNFIQGDRWIPASS